MASLICKRGRYTVQFRLRPNIDRATVALGAMTPEEAEAFRARVGILVDAYRSESPPDPSTAKWVAKLSDALHAKLAATGLVVARETPNAPRVPLLGAFIDAYISRRKADTSDNTQINLTRAKRALVDYFGATRPMNKVTPGDAEDFRLHLLETMSENTVRRLCGRAGQFFAVAVKHKLIAENPFAGMKCGFVETRERDFFVTRESAQKVLDACPDAEWRLLFALSRFGGLRCPSEHLGLRWSDIDWVGDRFTVRSPKTARKGKPFRVVPIFPELRPYLEDARELAEPGDEHVITRYRDRNSNLRTQLERILAKAHVEPWPKLFQNLRATRATELVSQGWPEYKVCEWLGHTEAIAKKHYWQVTDDDYRRAAAGLPAGPAALQMALQMQGEKRCNPMNHEIQAEAANLDNSPGCINSLLSALNSADARVPGRGLEPPRGCPHMVLSHARLPIPPSGQDLSRVYRRPGESKPLGAALGAKKPVRS